jgi:hypothetical protein
MTSTRQKSVLKKFIKGALIQAKTATHTQLLLEDMTALEKEQQERCCQGAQQLKQGGILYVSEARDMARQKKDEGGTQLTRAILREAELKKQLQNAEDTAQCWHTHYSTRSKV